MNSLKHRLPALITSALLLGISSGCTGQPLNGSRNLLRILPWVSSTGPSQAIPPAVSNPPSIPSSSSTAGQPRTGAGAPPPAQPPTPTQKQGAGSFPGDPYRIAADLFLLSIGLAGTVLGGLASRRLSLYWIAFDKCRREVQQNRTQLANLGSASRETSGSFTRVTEKLNRLEEKLLDVGNQLNATRSSLAAIQQEQLLPTRVDPYSTSLNTPQHSSYSIFNPDPLIPASYEAKSQSQPPTSAFSDLTRPANPQSSAQKQTQVTAAFNSGDRQTIRTETTALLNITTESENAIAMGQSVKTELQEESAGGSYCLVQISGEAWLYPSEQTLRSFSQYQPAKGVFEFIRQAVHSPQILSPALIVKNGSVWRVEQLGRIAVPG